MREVTEEKSDDFLAAFRVVKEGCISLIEDVHYKTPQFDLDMEAEITAMAIMISLKKFLREA